MDDGITDRDAAVAPVTGNPQAFTARQVMILRVMLAIMSLTLVGGGGLVVAALVWKLRQVPATNSTAEIQALAQSQPGIAFAQASLPRGARLISTEMAGDSLLLVYEDNDGTTLARFDARLWRLDGLARLSAAR